MSVMPSESSRIDERYTVLFICTANICRTPMATYKLRKLVHENGQEHAIAVLSAGTWAVDGAPAAEKSQIVCMENGMDASGHRSQSINSALLNGVDLVLCMSSEHKGDLLYVFPHLKDKIFTLREYAAETRPSTPNIADPYGSSLSQYRKTFTKVNAEILRIWPFIQQNARLKLAV